MSACRPCTEDIAAIRDRQGPDQYGIQIQIIANGHNTVPSWTRTAESRRARIAAIRQSCAKGHQGALP